MSLIKNTFFILLLALATGCAAVEEAETKNPTDTTDAADAADASDAADATDPQDPNVTINVVFDAFFEDIAWVLNDADGSMVDMGMPEAAGEATLNYALDDGEYCFTVSDAFGDGGLSISILVDGVEAIQWFGYQYTTDAEECFVVNTACIAEAGDDAAYTDECGVCDADTTNDCVEDCNGVWGGDALADACGTCDNDATNDCPATEVVATIVADQYFDETSWTVTNEFGTVIDSGAPEAQGESSKTWQLANGYYCLNVFDSYDDGGSTGSLTLGGVTNATWGATDYTDEANFCFTIGADCNGTDGGLAYADMCGTCDEDTTNDCVQDCTETWGGTATVDPCGTCVADGETACVPNTVIAANPDLYFAESSWILVDGESNEVAAGDFESADPFTATLELADGDYCFTMADSYGDGGTTGTITLNDVEYYTWAAGDYTTGAEFCFTIDSTCFASAEGAVLDACGVCDADMTNNCAFDCNGVAGGDAVADLCGTCDNDASNDCPAYTLSVTFSADDFYYESTWGILDADNNVLAQGAPEEAGSFTQSWELAAGRYCVVALDSYGDGGLAGVVSLDSTEIASWTADSFSGRSEVCFNIGPDCAGTVSGDAQEDECGVCDADPTNDCTQDCEGIWGGTAEGCGNVTLWLTCDENLEEVRWAVAGVDGYLDQGAPTEAYTSLGWDLPASVYRFLVYDSGDNGGCAGEIKVNGETVSAWTATAYQDIALVDITVE